MCPIKFNELSFDHIVEFSKDKTTFAAARENGNGHLRLLLITEQGNVYTRNGRADSWEEITGGARGNVLAKITEARSNHIPVYRINGTNGSI